MNYATLHTDGPVSVVTLNRPERLNAIGAELLADMHTALVQAQVDPNTRAIVLTGAGRAFCAGDDLKEFGEQSENPASISETCDNIQRITRDIMFGPKLVIGAVHGYAVGGGFEWVLNCDMVVAADNLICFFRNVAAQARRHEPAESAVGKRAGARAAGRHGVLRQPGHCREDPGLRRQSAVERP